MLTVVRHILPLAALILSTLIIEAEAQPALATAADSAKPAKPYRILTSGRQITIKSTKDIKSVMVWSSGGNRILEQKEVNNSNYNFRISVNEKIFFIRLQLADGKVYSEKIGIQ
ncbi:MAG TPA: hypothetical protein VHN59_04575 [Chitinophagaceae bacterium]|nr:hypothetical protein [Chitinophagaceae bacterium]